MAPKLNHARDVARKRLVKCLDLALAPGTKTAYAQRLQAFDTFNASVGRPNIKRITAQRLAEFVAYALDPQELNWAKSTALTAIAAVRHRCARNSNYVNKFDNPDGRRLLADTLAGGLKTPGRDNRARTRNPLTAGHLHQLLKLAKKWLVHRRLTFRAAALTCLATAARIGELLPRSRATFSNRQHATASNVSLVYPDDDGPRHYKFDIQKSKTDKAGSGHTLLVVDNKIRDADKNPFLAIQLLAKLATNSAKDSPLFTTKHGGPYTQRNFTIDLRELLKDNNDKPHLYASHSLRRGAASSLTWAGTNPSEIAAVGRWRSTSSQERYLQLPTDRIAALQRTVLKTKTTFKAHHGIN